MHFIQMDGFTMDVSLISEIVCEMDGGLVVTYAGNHYGFTHDQANAFLSCLLVTARRHAGIGTSFTAGSVAVEQSPPWRPKTAASHEQ